MHALKLRFIYSYRFVDAGKGFRSRILILIKFGITLWSVSIQYINRTWERFLKRKTFTFLRWWKTKWSFNVLSSIVVYLFIHLRDKNHHRAELSRNASFVDYAENAEATFFWTGRNFGSKYELNFLWQSQVQTKHESDWSRREKFLLYFTDIRPSVTFEYLMITMSNCFQTEIWVLCHGVVKTFNLVMFYIFWAMIIIFLKLNCRHFYYDIIGCCKIKKRYYFSIPYHRDRY